MRLKSIGWRRGLFVFAIVLAVSVEAFAANPRIVVEAGQTVANGWRVLGIGPAVAVNDARQVAYVAKVAKDGPVSIAVMRNRERLVWEGKRLADGAVVIDIEEDACPSINAKGEIAVPAQIRVDGLVRKAVIGADRALTWIGKTGGGRTITRWDNLECAPIDDRGRIAYFAYFDSRTGPRRGILRDDRPLVLVGQTLLDGSEVRSVASDVAMNGAGRIAVGAFLAPSDDALITQGRVLLRDEDLANDGTTIGLPPVGMPAINARGDTAIRVTLGLGEIAIVSRREILFRRDLVLPDRAVIGFSTIGEPVIDDRGIVAARAAAAHEGQISNTADALITQKGVAVLDGDVLPDGRRITDLEPPAINGRGEIAFVATLGGRQAVLLGKPTKGCRNLLDRDVPVPDGYGAAYDLSSAKLLVRVRCGFSRAILQVGTGESRIRVNPEAFLWQNGEWRPIELQGEERDADGWFIGAAAANLRLSGTKLLQEQQVLAHTCTQSIVDRRCGCRDSQCAETFWQLQRFRRPR